ncbi:MAG: GAF domain-containing SpoIIE family protein phosphatase [Myxococcota bacterium]
MQDDPQRSGSPSGPIQDTEVSGAFAFLAEMARDFADCLDLEATLQRALVAIVSHLDAEAGSLWLLECDGRMLVCHASVGPHPITGLHLPVTKGIIGRSVCENACQQVFDVTRDPNFASFVDEDSGLQTRSLLCAPMSFSDRPLGAIELVNKKGGSGHFDEGDIHPLRVLASSAALAISNAHMAASLVDHERVRRELELAAEIQRNLLPAPRSGPFPVFGMNVPARTVSGDFFDYLELEGGRIAFCVGDVSGKGMNAALLMAKTASLYRCLAKSIEGPGQLLAILNREICETATRGMFVTMLAGSYDPATGTMCLSSAGHEPALHHTAAGAFEAIEAEAPPLGIAPGTTFPERELALAGGTLYGFSDGLTEACGETGDQLGSEGVQRLIEQFAGKPLAERVRAIVAHVSGLHASDDLTLLAVCHAETQH